MAPGEQVVIAVDGARLNEAQLTPAALRARQTAAPEALFDLRAAPDVQWQPVAELALAACGSGVIDDLLEAPAALTRKWAKQAGALDPALLGRLDPGIDLGSGAVLGEAIGLPKAGQGKLDRAIIRRIMRQQAPKARRCYEEALRLSPKLAGKLIARFVVKPDGSVAEVEVKGSIEDQPMIDCVRGTVESIRFPTASGETRISYPFAFEPG